MMIQQKTGIIATAEKFKNYDFWYENMILGYVSLIVDSNNIVQKVPTSLMHLKFRIQISCVMKQMCFFSFL